MKARVCVCVSVMKIFMLMYMCKLIYGSHKSKKSVFLNHAQIYLFKQGFSLNLKHIHSSKPSEPAKPIRSSKPMSSRNPPVKSSSTVKGWVADVCHDAQYLHRYYGFKVRSSYLPRRHFTNHVILPSPGRIFY